MSTPTAAVARVQALLERKRYAEAAAEAEAGVRRFFDSVDLWTLLGAARILAGDLLGGVQATDQALKLDPTSAAARRNRTVGAEGLVERYRTALSALSTPQDEGLRLEQAYRSVREADEAGVLEGGARGISLAVFLRLCATEEADRRWPFSEIGRELALRGEHRSLINQLPRVRSAADRAELVDQHRLWGAAVESRAAIDPITPAPRGPRSRLRLGLLSSDLRLHAVTAFVEPLIAHAAGMGVDIYCYSAQPGAPDGAQRHLAEHVEAFRHLPGAEATDVARAIAADAPDVVIEIGGSTNANRPEALAHRLAPVQASWLGYPHSVGLSTIDYMVLDPYLAPSDPSLLIERPLLMPRSWIALSRGYFRAEPPPATETPQARKGWITFGSAGSPYKNSAQTLASWARVVAQVPGSRFLFVRPEGGSPTFRRNVAEHFARQGVSAERLEFAAVRGGHLPYYGEIDIALDSFPQTGGMTTCEALWMGVPVVSLAGPAVYERLSHSILNNVGLGDLSTDSPAAFEAAAVALAADPERRRAWRAGAREAIMAGPLGDGRQFAADFFALFRGALDAA